MNVHIYVLDLHTVVIREHRIEIGAHPIINMILDFDIVLDYLLMDSFFFQSATS